MSILYVAETLRKIVMRERVYLQKMQKANWGGEAGIFMFTLTLRHFKC